MASINISLSPAQVQRIALALNLLDQDKELSVSEETKRRLYAKIGSLEEFNLQGLTKQFQDAADSYNNLRSDFKWDGKITHAFCL